MGDEVCDLLEVLEETIGLLDWAGETHWRDWLELCSRRILHRDPYGAEHLLAAFGGPGSFSDLVLHPANGHLGEPGELVEANTRLVTLRETLHREAASLQAGQAPA